MTHRKKTDILEFLNSIADRLQRLVCFLIMKAMNDSAICRELGITKARLKLLKLKTAMDMRSFGIAPEEA